MARSSDATASSFPSSGLVLLSASLIEQTYLLAKFQLSGANTPHPQTSGNSPMLEAKLVKPEKSFKTQNSVPLKVILTNTSDQDLSVLTWNTPLDDVVTDCLEVTVNGKKVEYDGPIIKRGA